MENNSLQLPWLNAIYFCRLRLFYRAVASGQVDWFLGPEVRGSIGHQLKSYMGCPSDLNEDCAKCPQEKRGVCLYAQFFVHKNNSLIGMVLRLDPAFRSMKTDFYAGEVLQFDLILLGENAKMAFHVLSALRQNPLRLGDHGFVFKLIESGFVNEKGEFTPLSEKEEIPSRGLFSARYDSEWKQPLSLRIRTFFSRLFSIKHDSESNLLKPYRLELTLHTPTEITMTHRRYIYDPGELTFKLIVLRMLERTENIARDYCNWPEEAEGRKGLLAQTLIDESNKIALVENHAHWKRVKIRNSPERKTGGIVGSFLYEGNFGPYVGLLEAAVHLGIGKGTTSGFGHVSYRIL